MGFVFGFQFHIKFQGGLGGGANASLKGANAWPPPPPPPMQPCSFLLVLQLITGYNPIFLNCCDSASAITSVNLNEGNATKALCACGQKEEHCLCMCQKFPDFWLFVILSGFFRGTDVRLLSQLYLQLSNGAV